MTPCAEVPRPRVCADENCAAALVADNPRDYCGPRCRRRATRRRRERERHPGRPVKEKPRFIRVLRAEVPAGLCVYCEGKLVGLQRFVCRTPACLNAYIHDWHLEKDARRAAAGGEGEAELAAEARVDFEVGRLRLAVQLDALRAGVRELCQRLGVPPPVSTAQEGHGA
ncbi:hypothetical protein [Myxococcus sp. AS-1-15]|uniref:hypothetical protein n=1 Tax=Myxococcus sp. AS-1-15 TaxID=2874600 RepID=UPI001CBFA57C|nr:hypothetical protein [Myxococcus sp. AS-1-15]MBZ4395156.1 hypothetical protein [Myxococcus sp. AS-1-15]